MDKPTPFKISVSDDLLNFINQRVSTARIPPGLNLPSTSQWSDGVPPSVMHSVQQYWTLSYNWRAVEARINSHLKMYTIPISSHGENLTIHFVHHRSSRPNAIPLLFQHGWPGSFLEVEKIIDGLTDPEGEGQAYHVVAPSLPGFTFSSCPEGDEFTLRDMAEVDDRLMAMLGYEKYVGQGGDWGSIVVRYLGTLYPERCVAVHVNFVFARPPTLWKNPLTFLWWLGWVMWQDKSKDGSTLGRMMWWAKEESGYLEIQGTKPQTLSYALVDSPLGMAAWLRCRMEPLIDNGFSWSEEDTITWAMLYIIPGHSGHAQIYKNAKGKRALDQKVMLDTPISKKVDFGASIFPKEAMAIPRWWADVGVALNIVFWNEHEKGGHFASWEQPDVLVEDIREFTKKIRHGHMAALKENGK